MFQKKSLVVGSIVIFFGLVAGVLFYATKHKREMKTVEASTATNTITTQANWQLGSNSNINSTSSPGSIQIDSKSASALDLSGKTITADPDANKGNAVDGDNCNTYWLSGNSGFTYWTIDLGSEQTVYAKIWNDSLGAIEYSLNGSDWSLLSNSGELSECGGSINVTVTGIATFRYLRIHAEPNHYGGADPYALFKMYEVRIYGPASATHTTGATQIDGGENFWSWEGFTPTDNEPANTSITYRYRTSTDGATWTSWVADIGSVTSRTGDDSNDPVLYRYLQVEATLTNTDGASTPTIDSYDIGYHTNVKPSKPVAQTAVIQ